ncbi:acetyl/propionyl-CoA carboxylase subuit alpha [Lentzea sp. NBRC 105346]|uniref:acetyl/propionyl/methylcrotonyl-CoA carboxylase subunit alpha n=1 Tax=Lentzea sp. NBRC 105346 TaxID=3032205 RepID=UPI0024A591DA|nr:biotin carboxylase N-terminal domain-containing protein [Lentzea sp. NBRC 105346]GLZ34766.1 acetyl/propionyl-CoA carboxylase subuit alpha [Lentzea sp. NBRC 105346]
MIQTLLIANRGEIACRIIRTCRDLGIRTVAVFSDPDADMPHVKLADASVRLPGASPAETYLRADLIVEAARQAGADAVHPGYGFLSENADFPRAVAAAGLTWVGPTCEAIEAMGSKVAAKKRMAAAGVPVLPELDPETVTSFPVLIKASAGGGGRGMRIVRSAAELPDALASARREAESAFGDATVFCEPLLERARHVEVQVLADKHGTVWTLGERECSIQRRHQKIIEETPSPAVSPEVRKRLFEAAVAAAESIGYVSAGTVEFMLQGDEFYFLEVNTRLQVEHPVTELVYGIDLVEWQLRIAEGEPLPELPAPNGHAIEARVYAEDPAHDWRPASGVLHRFEVPGDVRVDSGVEDGSVVSVHYDPMLAKVIAWAPNRAAAARKLAGALAGSKIHGLVTNRTLLVDILRHPAFVSGQTHTGFLTEHSFDTAIAPKPFALAAALAQAASRRVGALPLGWRNLRSQQPKARYLFGDEVIEVEYDPAQASSDVVLDLGGVRTRFSVAVYGDVVEVDSPLGSVTLRVVPRFPSPESVLAPGALVAPMPGNVVRVSVSAGQSVAAGDELIVLEAMKMEHRVLAPAAGVVSELLVAQGKQVNAGDVLVVVEES